MKKRSALIIAIFLVLCALLQAAVTLANNRIAAELEARLRAYPLPPDTRLLDSLSVAGKMEGNGNGMQYFGELLITSDLTRDQLRAHYAGLQSPGESISLSVAVQETPALFARADIAFSQFDESAPCWRVELYRDSPVGCEDTLWEALLNCDPRGH